MTTATLAKPKPQPAPPLREYRCPVCNHLLLKGEVAAPSKLQPYCKRCKRVRVIVIA